MGENYCEICGSNLDVSNTALPDPRDELLDKMAEVLMDHVLLGKCRATDTVLAKYDKHKATVSKTEIADKETTDGK